MEDDSTEQDDTHARPITINAISVETRQAENGDILVHVVGRIGNGLVKPSLIVGDHGKRMSILAGRLMGPVQIKMVLASWALNGGEPGEGK